MKNFREQLKKGRSARESKLHILSGKGIPTPQGEKKARKKWYQEPGFQLGMGGTLFIGVIFFLLLPKALFIFPDLQVGDLVQQEIKAPTNIQIPDISTNQKSRENAQSETPSVYDFDLQPLDDVERKVREGFASLRISSSTPDASQDSPSPETSAADISYRQLAREGLFQEILGIDLSPKALKALHDAHFDPIIEEKVISLHRAIMERGIILDKNLLKGDSKKGIFLRVVGEEKESFLRNIDLILDMEIAKQIVRQSIQSDPQLTPLQKKPIQEIVLGFLKPNLTFNKSETVIRQKESVTHVKPVFYKVKKGEILLKTGERVTNDHVPLLQFMHRYRQPSTVIQIGLGLLLIVMVILGIFFLDFRKFYSKKLFDNNKSIFLLAVLLAGTLFIAKFSHFFLITLADRFPLIDATTISFALPVAAGAMLITLLFDIHIALLCSFILSLLMGLLVPEEDLFILYTFVGSLVAALSVMKCSRRSGLLQAGLLVGMANAFMLFSINLYQGELLSINSLFEILFGLSGGLLVTLVVSVLLPLMESLFKVTTDIKLLELLDPNQPLLRDLFLTARGTYYHSMMVSHLAESAAETIEENPLLARVSCYYHDIGKMLKPEYYIENQLVGPNRHDHLSPNMSSLIIASHVKEGIELGRSYKLPEVIVDIIPQHHGTRLMKFFYEKAKQNHGPGMPPIKEDDFRYPGPKPQTKVAGIIMLADGVEASSRVLSDPSPARIETHVEKTVTNIFIDGQLDECNLTMSDLRKIKECFTRVLTGVFHKRVEYPGEGPPYYGDSGHENPDQKPTADTQIKNKEYKKVSRQDSSDAEVY